MIEALSSEFEILAEVGRGGMGVVYKARQISLDRIVAIKMLLREFAKDDEFINRFKREARAVAALNHQNIVDIYDIREAGGTWFIITEFVGGGTLRDLLRRQKILDLNESTRILYDCCSALFYTHKKGIIHRDIKPDNVMFNDSREVKVADFGLARLSDSSFQTRTGLSMGTPRYMAPEQASGKPTDHRSDIYSLAIMYFEMLTGQVPFEGDNAFAVVYKHINEPPPAPSTVNPQLPEWADKVILKALSKKLEDRFQDCEEFGKALEGSISTPSKISWTAPVTDEHAAPKGDRTIQVTAKYQGKPSPQPTLTVKPKTQKKNPLPLVAGIVGLLIAAVAGVYFISQGTHPSPGTDLATPTPVADAGTSTPSETVVGLQAERDQVKKDSEPIEKLAQDGKIDEAVSAAKKLFEAHPDSQEAKDLLASLQDKSDRKQQARELIARAKDHWQNARNNQADSDLQEALRLDPDNAEASSLIKEVQKGLAKGQDIPPESPGKETSLDSRLAQAEDFLRGGKYPELAVIAQQIVEEAKKVSGPAADKAREKASTFAKAAESIPSLLAQAEAGLNKRNTPGVRDAIKACEEVLKQNPSDPVAARYQSMATQQLASLETELQDILAEGKKFYERADLEGAKRQFDKALQIQPDHEQAKALSQEIEAKVDEVTSKRIQGTTWFSQREYAKARKEYEGILKVIPGDTEAAQMIAKCDEAIEKGGAAKPPEPEMPQPQPVKPAVPSEPSAPATGGPAAEIADYAPSGAMGASGEGLLQQPVDVFATQSAIYVVDEGRCQVVKFDLEGKYLTAWGTKSKALNPLGGDMPNGEFAKPCSVAADRNDNVYVLDSRSRLIQKFDKDGNFLSKWGGKGEGRGGFGTPVGITVGSDASVFVVDTEQCRVQKFNSEGQFLAEWGSKGTYSKELQGPMDICADWEGFIYVADTGNSRVQKYNLEGSYITFFALKEESAKHEPIGIGADTNSSVYVVDAASSTIQKFTKLSRYVSVFGSKGGSAGQLRDPKGVAVMPSGTVLIANSGNARIEKYTPAKK